jgi:3-hydroxyisobutyrate dehydrogenase-like beta-hydroxyacid dehydrogenase
MRPEAQKTGGAMGEKLAFIGLGVMGGNIAARLVRAGHDVTVFNRTQARAEQFVEMYGGRTQPSAAAAARDARVVLLCVGNDDHVRQVTQGPDGAFASMQPGALLIDHSTTSADLARELGREATKRRLGALDAPVSGGQQGAEQGTLTVMVGGHADHFAQAQPLFAAYARHAQLLGPSGSGQLAKMVNQICIAGVLQGLAEGLHFAELAGLDAAAVIDVIAQGAAQSWQMVNRHQAMIDDSFDFGFAVDWMRKDLGFALTEARRNGARLPLTALVDQFYADVQALGGSRWDTSSLITRLRSPASKTQF